MQRNLRRTAGTTLLTVMGLFLLLPGAVWAASAASLSVGYTTSQMLPNGALVAPDEQKAGSVVAANSTNSNIVGVVVPSSTLSVSQDNSQVQVSGEGQAVALVSDVNGDVKKGDHIAPSPLDGIGMKATESGKVLGIVQSDLTNSSAEARQQTITDIHGVEKKILVASVPVAINIGFYQPVQQKTLLPKFLRDIGASVSGKEVSAPRLYGSLAVMTISLAIVMILLYGAVRSSIRAIGRNPLAQSAIQNSLGKVLAISVLILAVSGAAILAILRG